MRGFLAQGAKLFADAQETVDPLLAFGAIHRYRAIDDIGIGERADRKAVLKVLDAEAARVAIE